MSCGIYKITNLKNNHCYIGQSRNIEKRWNAHKNCTYNSEVWDYPLYKAFRKYGLENFSFKIIEKCSLENLNEREIYWIKYYQPEYNQTIGGNFNVIPQKLTYEQVQEIQQALINDKEGKISHTELGKKYGVSGKDTIRDINVGRTWFNPNYTYPLHQSVYTGTHKNYCIDCGKIISKNASRCNKCNSIFRVKENQIKLPVTREELKNLIRTTSFVQIGKLYNVTDNAIRKWCKNYNLPYRAKDIKIISDEDWINI
jgi:group I intron endonuclease